MTNPVQKLFSLAEMDAETKAKAPEWEGKATAKVTGATPEQIWPFLEDFCNLHNWLPTITTCYQVEGILRQPGLVRLVASNNDTTSDSVKWAKEKLLSIDPVARTLSYEVTENNVGFGFYVATLKVSSVEEGCEIEWSFVSDPVHGWKFDDLLSFIQVSLQGMAAKMEQALLKP